jgi:hypothetical protein
VADKPQQLVLAALSRAAADPAGTPLVGGKADPGLFPNTAAAKLTARKALDDGLLHMIRTETKGKQTRELCAITEKGLRFLLEQVSPKQVLEDFVRVLEQREGQVSDLLAAAMRMAESLDGLKTAVALVLPQVRAERVPFRAGSVSDGCGEDPSLTLPARKEGNRSVHPMNGVATLEAPVVVAAPDTLDDLAGAILARLSDWAASAGAGQDCPLPELYRSLTCREVPPTIGAFHDCLRQLHADRRIYLHPWTGPLYALPEPTYALLAGHNVAYYASPRN